MAEAGGLRIALLTHSVNPRGGVVHTLELGRALQAAGHEVTVMAPAAPGERFFRATPCRVELAPLAEAAPGMAGAVKARIDAYVAHLARLLQTTRFDILHAQDGIGGNALTTLAERGSIPGHVRTVHHLDRFDDPQLDAWQLRALKGATGLLCVSRVWRDLLARDYGLQAQEVHNGVDTARFQPHSGPGDNGLAHRLGLGAAGPTILAVGGVEARKNSLALLEAFLLLRRRLPDARLLIAGGASLLDHDACARRFRARAEEGGLAIGPGRPVQLTGPLPDEDMPGLFRLADVLALPSRSEGFGLVALEALACGTPVVVSRIPPFTEYLDEPLCHWADPAEPASIAAALAAAFRAIRGAPLARLAAPLLRRFTWEGSAAQHIAAYRELFESSSTD